MVERLVTLGELSRMQANSYSASHRDSSLVGVPKHSDQEIRVVGKRSHIPSREKNIGSESCPRRVFEEVAERIPAPGTEPDNCPTVLAEMGAKAFQN